MLSVLSLTGHFCLQPEVFKASTENSDIILQDFRQAITSKNKGHLTALSIGSCQWCPVGTAYRFEYFGDTSLHSLLAHLRIHFKEILQAHAKHGGNISLWIFIPISVDQHEFKAIVCDRLGLYGKEENMMEQMLQKYPFGKTFFKSNV